MTIYFSAHFLRKAEKNLSLLVVWLNFFLINWMFFNKEYFEQNELEKKNLSDTCIC